MTNNNELSSNPLQLKMPVVGRRYKDIRNYQECRAIHINQESVVLEYQNDDIGTCRPEIFFDKIFGFEELPEQEEKPTIKKSLQVEKAKEELREEQTDSIDGALYELKYEIQCLQNDDDLGINLKTCIEDLYQKKIYRLMDKAQNLINAMDDSNMPEKGN